MATGGVPPDRAGEDPVGVGRGRPRDRREDEKVERPYHGVWIVNADGVMTGPGGISATDEERNAFIHRIEAKVEAGTVSMTERRCLAAARHRRGGSRDD